MKQKIKMKWKRLMTAVLLVVMIVAGGQSYAAEENEDSASVSDQMVKPSNLNTEGYDVVILADNSGSVWSQQGDRDKALRGIANLAVGSDIRIGAVYFGETTYKKLGLTSMEDQDSSTKVLDFLNLTEKNENNRGTNIGNALEEAQTLFEDQNANRQKIIILFSDGINENLSQSSSFKEAADRETLEQAQSLKEKQIPIYCVYLQKNRNDEDYLKQLVNYFNEDNDYADERFKKVTDDQIDILSEQFAQTFYSMQNDMKYREISIDSSGTMSFYIPELGVRRMQIYLKNDKAYEVLLSGPSEDSGEAQTWGDNGNVYITVDEPETGDWTLEITGDGADTVTGTLACYTDISASSSISGEVDENGNIYRNRPEKINVSFYDEDGSEFRPDEAAVVSGTVTVQNEAGENITRDVEYGSTENGYESAEFQIEDYGTYSYQVSLSYADFINLRYDFEGGTVQGMAPLAYDQEGTFEGRETGDGEAFTFETDDLYSDPDGEKITITGVTQLNEENPVISVEEKEGFLTVTAQDTGDVDFVINIEDESGNTAQVEIKGKVMDVVTARIITGLLIFLLIVVLTAIVSLLIYRRKMKNEVEEALQKMRKAFNGFDDDVHSADNIIKLRGEIKSNLNNLYNNICELVGEKIDREQLEHFGIREDDFKDLSEKYPNFLDSSYDDVIDKLGACRKLQSEAERKTGKKPSRKNLSLIIAYTEKFVDKTAKFNSTVQEYSDAHKRIKEKADFIADRYVEILDMLETPIKCNIIVMWDKYIGSKECRRAKDSIRGYYRLDDVGMLDKNGTVSLRNLMNERTGIYVYGCQDSEGEDALRICSKDGFYFKNTADGKEETKVKEAVLMKGENYRVKINDYMGFIGIQVK